jgi:hypothetical protein
MTLQELRRLSDSVRRIPCDPAGDVPEAVRAYNSDVTRFQELVVLVRNRIVLAEPGQVPAGADQVRTWASALSARRPPERAGEVPAWLPEPTPAPVDLRQLFS